MRIMYIEKLKNPSFFECKCFIEFTIFSFDIQPGMELFVSDIAVVGREHECDGTASLHTPYDAPPCTAVTDDFFVIIKADRRTVTGYRDFLACLIHLSDIQDEKVCFKIMSVVIHRGK